eukprot:gene29986-30473_t
MAVPGGGPSGAAPRYLSAETIRRHPLFDEAVALLIDDLARLHGDDRRLVRGLFEYDRAVIFMLAICIAMNAREDDPATWLTLASLAEGAVHL